MAYTAVLQAREIGKKDMDMVRAAVKLSEERAAKAAAANTQQTPAPQHDNKKR